MIGVLKGEHFTHTIILYSFSSLSSKEQSGLSRSPDGVSGTAMPP